MAFQHHRAVIVRTGVVLGAHLNLRNEANFCQENQLKTVRTLSIRHCRAGLMPGNDQWFIGA
jgi:hypothetical protein